MNNSFKYLYSCALAVLLLILNFSSVVAQTESSDVYLRIYGAMVNSDNNDNLSECVVRVLRDEEYLEQYKTKGSGKYEFFLPAGHTYRFYYEKEGFVSKNIEINSVDAANMNDQFIFSLKADISLFKEISGMNYDVLDQPIGKGVCNGRKGKVQFDKDYTRNMEEQIALLYVPVEANTSEVSRVTLSEAITEVPEEDNELTVNEIFEAAEKENERLQADESEANNLKIIEEEVESILEEVVIPETIDVPPIEEEIAIDVDEPKELPKLVAQKSFPPAIAVEKKEPEPKVVTPVKTLTSDSSVDITWRVQLGAFTSDNINAFHGLSDIDFIKGADGITRCVAGYHATPMEAAKHKVELINKGYDDAFITAYKGDKRISLKETGMNLEHISYTRIKDEMRE